MQSLLFIAALFAAADSPQNWPQYRGLNGDGIGTGSFPTTWSETENIRWKTAIHDKGWSSPVVWGDQIWLTTALKTGKEFFAIAVDRKTGKIVHDVPLFTEANPAFCHDFNSYASPTPVIEAGRVYCHVGTYGTACLDTATGKTIWTNRDYKCDHYRGPGSSPILYENLLILTFDGFDVNYTVALDKATGKQVWKQDHNIKYASNNGDFHKAYGTPNVLMVKGQPQLVSPSAEATIAREPRTGKELWRISTGGMNQSMRPILANNLIYLSCGHEQKVLAVKAGTTEIAWKSVKEAPSRPSILVLGNQVYMVNDKGVATCLNALTGKPVWRERFDGEFSASPVCANGMMVFSNEQGKSFVLEASGEYKPVATNKLDAGCMASPAIVDDCLILRTKTHLYCIGKK